FDGLPKLRRTPERVPNNVRPPRRLKRVQKANLAIALRTPKLHAEGAVICEHKLVAIPRRYRPPRLRPRTRIRVRLIIRITEYPFIEPVIVPLGVAEFAVRLQFGRQPITESLVVEKVVDNLTGVHLEIGFAPLESMPIRPIPDVLLVYQISDPAEH